eukprot:CAMPEP_0197591900 /NCGR_PEP_ID=MMETSP1326-20131121/14046_1 /TAXON_ID=1155430 /ORGANISM="Genus nov. species nov., Strain RCC2288" /LENGTH=188 /DNA_ID=CAMNT_0043157479 /DNA_START=51 /DNA_END=617 /DNA_ORIENTATION=+
MSFVISAAAARPLAARHTKAAAPKNARQARRATIVVRAAADDDDADDSRGYRKADSETSGLGGFISRLPSGRKESAPESYGSRPQSRTLEEGRYRRPPPERVGGVTEESVRGDDFQLVEGPSFGIGTAVGVFVAAATLGIVYLTVTKLGDGPVQKKGSRMPSSDRELAAKAAPTAAVEVVTAPAVAIE